MATASRTYYFIDKREHSILTFISDLNVELVKERGDAALYRVENDETPLAELTRDQRWKRIVALRSDPTTTKFGTALNIEVVSTFDSRPLDKILKKERATFGATRKWRLSVHDDSEVKYLTDAIFDVYAKEIGVSESDGISSIFFVG